MDLAQFLVPNTQNNPPKTQQGSNALPGSGVSAEGLEKEGLSAFDQILNSVNGVQDTQFDTSQDASLSDEGLISIATPQEPLTEGEEIAALLGMVDQVTGQNLPPALLEALPVELRAALPQNATPEQLNVALETFLHDNPQRIGEVLSLVQSHGVDVSSVDIGAVLNGIEPSALPSSDVTASLETQALQHTVSHAVSAPEASLSARLGILDTVIVADDAPQAPAAQTSQTPANALTLSDEQISNIARLLDTNSSGIPNIPDLTTTGMTIEQIAELPVVNEAAPEIGERVNLVDQFVSLVTPNKSTEDGLNIAQTLNNLVVGDVPDQNALQPVTPLAPVEEPSNFELLLKQLIGFQGGNDNQAATTPRGENPASQNGIGRGADAGQDVLPLRQSMTQNTALNGASGNDVILPPAPLTGSGAEFSDVLNTTALSSSSPILTPGQSALLAQANSASASHPATQMVAATLQKGGQLGQDTQITLRLDPAELGKVEVKLSFDVDNAMRAVVTAEKPETHMMMQRDSNALMKSLQEAGINIDSDSGLSFELAQDGSFFDNQDKESGGNGSSGSDSDLGDITANSDDADVIESSMTWEHNPETGHTHYSILA
ncbi:MAG: flagellar hook-length control protein FliK [Alphaproteobacteria bacterium]